MSIIEAVWEGEDYGGDLPTPVDTPLVTPIDAKTDQDKELPFISTTKDERKSEPKIEGTETAVEHEIAEASEAGATHEAVEAATEKIETMILNADVEETVKTSEPSLPSRATHSQVTDTLA